MPTIIAMQMNSRNMLAGGLCRSKDISSMTNMDSTMLHVIMSLFEVKYFLLFIAFRVLCMWPGAVGILDMGKVRNIMSDKQMDTSRNCWFCFIFLEHGQKCNF